MRLARKEDVPAIVRLFALPEEHNAKHEEPGPPLPRAYQDAFDAIASDANNALWIAEHEGAVGGVFQLTVIQYLANRGGRVAQIENVVVDPAVRSRGIGETMMRWAIDEARRRGCFRIQLTSNKRRARAHGFYARLGFVASHEGFKLLLGAAAR